MKIKLSALVCTLAYELLFINNLCLFLTCSKNLLIFLMRLNVLLAQKSPFPSAYR